MKIKNVVKIILFCVIFLLIVNRVYKVLAWKDTAGDYTSSLESYYDLEEDLVDVVFFGSSRCYCSIDNSLLWNKYGISSFSMAISGQDFAGTYHTMKEALKTQTPEMFIVELYGSLFSGYEVEGNLYRNTLSFRYSQDYLDIVNDLVEDEEKKADFLLKWPIFHTRYAELKRQDFQKERPVYLGYSAGFYTNPVEEVEVYEGNEMTPWPQEREEWFRKIIQLAEENNVKLCFFVAPYVGFENDQKMLLYAESIAKEHDIPVLNFIKLKEEANIIATEDYIDWAHTNYFGAQKVTKYIGQFLAANYELEDHRGDQRYELWEENSKARAHEVQNYQMRKMYNIGGYLDILSYVEDYVVVVSTAGNHVAQNTDITGYLEPLGIGEEFYNENGGVWVIDNGELVYSNHDLNAYYHLELKNSDLVVSRANGVNSIALDRQTYLKSSDGINILIYDKILEQVVDSPGFSALDSYSIIR